MFWSGKSVFVWKIGFSGQIKIIEQLGNIIFFASKNDIVTSKQKKKIFFSMHLLSATIFQSYVTHCSHGGFISNVWAFAHWRIYAKSFRTREQCTNSMTWTVIIHTIINLYEIPKNSLRLKISMTFVKCIHFWDSFLWNRDKWYDINISEMYLLQETYLIQKRKTFDVTWPQITSKFLPF